MAGVLLTMPLLIMNMGGEMVYILHQRLKAQNIDSDKSKKVLGDVVKTMYNSKFLAELFKPQQMYTSNSTKKIFERLAHSSIMRLNESSMNKLYDLMSMGFKHQIMSCASPDMLLRVTLNHLETLEDLSGSKVTTPLLDAARNQVTQLYGSLNMGDFQLLRQQLFRFFQDRRVKVSIFLQENNQNGDGTFKIRPEGMMATGADIPGTVREFDANGRESNRLRLDLPSATDVEESNVSNPIDVTTDICPFGENIYAPGRIPRSKSPEDKTLPQDKQVAQEKTISSSSSSPKKYKVSGTQELNILATLLGSAAEEAKPLKLNLFTQDPFDDLVDSSPLQVRTIQIDGNSDRKTAHHVVADFDDEKKSDAKDHQNDNDDDDLLSLMDST